jgi:3-oxoacyl-[acyl-carrier protein] reductase
VSGLAGQTAYAASKAGLLGITRALAREVGKRGIRVNAVLPGFVPTDMTASLPEEVVRGLRSHECLPRGTSAADIANLVTFLISEKAAAITGQALIVDAGTSA